MFGRLLGGICETARSYGGLVWKMPYKLSETRKANVRKRLSMVETNINELKKSGIYVKVLDRLLLEPRYSMLKPRDRYTYWAKNIQGRKPVQFHSKYTKVDLPTRVHPGYEYDG
jgi:hypothetical protein